jgi:hypothetical protein
VLYKHINSAALQAAENHRGQAGEKGVLLATKRDKMHKRDKKTVKKVLYKHINSGALGT